MLPTVQNTHAGRRMLTTRCMRAMRLPIPEAAPGSRSNQIRTIAASISTTVISSIRADNMQPTMRPTMQNHSNAGARLYSILEKGSSLPDNMAVLKAWALLFDIHEPFGVELSVDVAERLVGLNQDLKRLQNLGNASDRPQAILRHIEQALSPVYLSSNWEVVKQFLPPDDLKVFRQWAEALPKAETAIEGE